MVVVVMVRGRVVVTARALAKASQRPENLTWIPAKGSEKLVFLDNI
ncbi:Unknown protein sequence [Pseudomonas syringae pv. rhaphiolepidis]|nr:Unknown protein sequence [Pseudomonas syringae pv. rhaphiolepidis]